MVVTHHCLRCAASLACEREVMACPACGARWPRVGEVPVYATAPYFGEIGPAEMADLVREAETGHWFKAVERRFKDSNQALYRYIADLNRASWIPLLPIGPGSTVLDVGSGLGCLTHALALTYERVVSTEPVEERVRFTRARLAQEGLDNVDLVQTTVDRLPFAAGTFDLILLNGILEWVGAWSAERDPRRAQVRVLATLRRLLRPGGLLLIGIENRLGYTSFLGRLDHPGVRFTNLMPRWAASAYLRLRRPGFYRAGLDAAQGYRTYTYSPRGYGRLLREAGFDRIDCWWPLDGYNLPHVLYRADARGEIVEHFRRARRFQDRSKGPALRRLVKEWTLVRTGLIARMFPDLVLLAGADGPGEREEAAGGPALIRKVREAVALRTGASAAALQPSALWSRGYRNKTVLKLAGPEGDLVAIAKVANRRLPGAEGIARGHELLLRLESSFATGDDCLQGSVPSPVACLEVGTLAAGVELAVPGRSLLDRCLERGYFADRRRVRDDLGRVAAWIAAAQAKLEEVGARLAKEGVPLTWRGLGEGSKAKGPLPQGVVEAWVQHGDLYPGNLLLDPRDGRLTVIDWDDCGPGYPPLFDWFCILAGLYYTHERTPRIPRGGTVDRRAFRETFFEPSWFADVVLGLTAYLCDRMGLARERVVEFFTQHLAVRHHQFQRGRGSDLRGPWRERYRDLYVFALRHEDCCIFRRLGAGHGQGVDRGARRIERAVGAGLLAGALLLGPSGPCGAAGEVGDLAIHPAPPPLPLPGAGRQFRDPTYGTNLVQVTDERDGARAFHAYSQWSPFNSDSRRFLIHIEKEGWILYDFDPATMGTRKGGPLPAVEDGRLDLMYAHWDGADPDVLYATVQSRTIRKLYRFNVAAGRGTVLHDFTGAVPGGGWYGGLDASADSRYFCVWVSATGGQDTGRTVAVYDRQTDRVFRRDLTEAEVGRGVHSLGMDKAGEYVVISASPLDPAVQPRWLVWRFLTDEVTPLLGDEQTKAGGHGEEGYRVLVHSNGWQGGQVLLRPLDDPHRIVPVFDVPPREGKAQWQTDYHFTWNHRDRRFFFLDSLTIWPTTGWVKADGSVYRAPEWSRRHPSHLAPEEVRLDGRLLRKAEGKPGAPGQWAFDQAGDSLALWPEEGTDLTQPGHRVIALDWRPFQDEIVQVWVDGAGATKARRLAHHQSRVAGRDAYRDEPHAASDWSGRFVMFTSNWGGRSRQDVFILRVPDEGGGTR